MVRIFSHIFMALALAGFLLPGSSTKADAGKRYQISGGKTWSGKLRGFGGRHRNNGFILRIPQSFLNGDYQPAPVKRRAGEYGIDAKPWRSGPKIIKVEEVLRERRRRQLEE